MASVQMETGGGPCRECHGDRVTYVLPLSCRHAGQNCPCGLVEIECPACHGSGVEGGDHGR